MLNLLPTSSHQPMACFSVTARPDLALMANIFALSTQMGFVPGRISGLMDNTSEPHLELDIQAPDLSSERTIDVVYSIRQIHGVDQVFTAKRIIEMH